MATPSADIGVVVALPEELQCLLNTLRRRKLHVRHCEVDGYDYYEAEIRSPRGRQTMVLVLIGGMGPERASRATMRMLEHWNIHTIAMLGIAGALNKDCRLGDVIVADQIDAYVSAGKVVPDGNGGFTFERRGEAYRSDNRLVQRLLNFRFAHEGVFRQWQNCRRRAIRCVLGPNLLRDLQRSGLVAPKPECHVGPLASGPFVVASTAFCDWLKLRNTTLLGVDMESAGVFAAVYEATKHVRTIALRAVSDMADEDKGNLEARTKGIVRRIAMENASTLLCLLVETGLVAPTDAPDSVRSTTGHPARFSGAASPGTAGSAPGDSWSAQKRLEDLMLSQPTRKGLVELRVLLVDDDPQGRRALARHVRLARARPLEAPDAEEALRMLEEVAVDVILTDVGLPGVNGLKLTEEVHARHPEVPVIVTSGFGAENTRSEAIAAGALAYLDKPIDVGTLVGALQRASQASQLQRLALELWPRDATAWLELSACRSAINGFLQENQSAELFASMLRHKAKESVRTWARSTTSHPSSKPSTEKLTAEIAKLRDVMRKLHDGLPQGLPAYIESLKADLEALHPELHIRTSVAPLGWLDKAPTLSAFLLLACTELVDNANDALRGAGQIKIEMRFYSTLNQVSLRVWNSGPDIPAASRSRIFDEGFSTKGHARGLGLSLIRRLAARFGGSFTLSKAQANFGVEFVVTASTRPQPGSELPLADAGNPDKSISGG